MRVLERAGAAEIEHGYEPGGQAGVVELSVPARAEKAVGDELREATSGAVLPERLAAAVLYRNAAG